MIGRSAWKLNINTTKALSFLFVQNKAKSRNKEVRKYKLKKH